MDFCRRLDKEEGSVKVKGVSSYLLFLSLETVIDFI